MTCRDQLGRFLKGHSEFKGIPRPPLSEEHKQKIREKSIFQLGSIPWNKGKGDYVKGEKNPFFGKHHSEETKRKISEIQTGKKHPCKGIQGEKHYNWKGGKSELKHRIRTSFPYLKWRAEVYKRDHWTCQTCGKRGKDIHAHHIIPISKILDKVAMVLDVNDKFLLAMSLPELFDVNNGVTLCKNCHILTFEVRNGSL